MKHKTYKVCSILVILSGLLQIVAGIVLVLVNGIVDTAVLIFLKVDAAILIINGSGMIWIGISMLLNKDDEEMFYD